MKMNQYYLFDDEAKEFLYSIMSFYPGTTTEKIKRTVEFLDDLIFKTESDLENPFSNDSRNYYKLAKYSRKILIPEILLALETVTDSDPFNIHDWN
jgi:hypothetical protein